MANVKAIIDGVNWSPEVGSVKIKNNINERSTARFTFVDENAANNVEKNDKVTIKNASGNVIFAGFIEKRTEQRLQKKKRALRVKVKCKDMTWLTEKRLVADTFTNETTGSIVRKLINGEALADQSNLNKAEDIEEGVIEDGDTVQTVKFNYVPAFDAIEEMATESRFWWDINKDRELSFRARSSNQSSIVVDPSNDIFRSSKLVKQNPKYRNKQWVLEASQVTDTLTENLPTGGTQTSWELGFRVADEEPVVKVNNNKKNVDVKKKDGDADFFYEVGESSLRQNIDNSTLSSSDSLKVEYKGQAEIIGRAEDELQIEQEGDKNNTSGIIEKAEDRPNIDSLTGAGDTAKRLIEKFGTIGRTFTFETRKTGIEPGQVIEISDPVYGLSNTCFLVERVKVSDKLKDDLDWFKVKCIEGPINKSWKQVFYELATDRRRDFISKNIGREEAVVIREDKSHVWSKDNQPDIFDQIRPGNDRAPGMVPAFPKDKKIEYVAVGDGDYPGTDQLDNEIARAPVDITENELTGQMRTIATFLKDQANFTWTEIGWFGGHRASKAPNSGTMIKWQTVDTTKTSEEKIQVDSRDDQVTPTYNFEDGSLPNQWTDNSGEFTVENSSDSGIPNFEPYITNFTSDFVAGAEKDSATKVIATAEPGLLADGQKPDMVEFFMYEKSANKGGGIQLLNSNGDVEVGFALDNPQWYLDSDNGVVNEYSGDGSDRWIYVRFDFFWSDSGTSSFDVFAEELRYPRNIFNPVGGGVYGELGGTYGVGGYGDGEYGPGYDALKKDVDLEKIQVTNFESGSWTGNSDFYMFFDNITVVRDTIDSLNTGLCA